MTSTAESALPLRECPFCGGTDTRLSSRTSGHGESTAYVHCNRCDGRMEDYYGRPDKKWNIRYTDEIINKIKQLIDHAPMPMVVGEKIASWNAKYMAWHIVRIEVMNLLEK